MGLSLGEEQNLHFIFQGRFGRSILLTSPHRHGSGVEKAYLNDIVIYFSIDCPYSSLF